MRSFFKIFFASLLSLVIFSLIVFFLFIGFMAGLATKSKPRVEEKSVLVLNLGQYFREQKQENPIPGITGNTDGDVPGLYDVIRSLRKAKEDRKIEGIYIIANNNPNGFAASEELRAALLDFKTSGKFIIAHGEAITQKAYFIASVADKIYANPTGFVEWTGFNVDYVFLKGLLDKLQIEPQIFYAGKFKSATEPFRTDQMTPENELQTSVWLNDIYSQFLLRAAEARKMDTANLRQLANDGIIQNAQDAVVHKLVDGAKYDDEVKDEFKAKLKLDKYDRINFISIYKYAAAGGYANTGSNRIALIYAEGDIVDGEGSDGMIGSEKFRQLIRKARLDKSIKAIVFRVNSGGGSALASENILRELALAKKEKPVVVSFGDVAASGGYYISCAADSIFAMPTTITGSIGVFGLIPNMEGFFRNKLGITFDGVQTSPYADMGAIYRPMSENEKRIVQTEIERIYSQFKQRVAEGRGMDTATVDSIGQGRVWTGGRAQGIGLIDRFGGLQQAVECAARLAKVGDNYRLREYPQVETIWQKLFGPKSNEADSRIRKEIGEDNYKIYKELARVRQMTNSFQARLPFEFFIN